MSEGVKSGIDKYLCTLHTYDQPLIIQTHPDIFSLPKASFIVHS